MSCQSSTFLLSAATASWGRRDKSCVDVNAGGSGLSAKYFLVDAPSADFAASVGYYVWFNTGASVDPAVSGRTGIAVAILSGDTEVQVALKLKNAVEAHASFYAKLHPTDSSIVIIEAKYKGPVSTEIAAGDSGFEVETAVIGFGGDLGKTSGGVTISMESTVAQIISDQTGQIPLDELLTGQTIEVSMSLLEMDLANWKKIVGGFAGESFTPGGGSELVGFGTSRLYASALDFGGELVLHPTRYPESDRSRNITIWKAAPKPSSINFSGSDPQIMEVTFTALPDTNLDPSINMMAFGDNEQDVRA